MAAVTVDDAGREGRVRLAVSLAPDLWDWLERTAAHDGTSRSDLLEGLVMLAMDEEQAKAAAIAAGSDRRPSFNRRNR